MWMWRFDVPCSNVNPASLTFKRQVSVDGKKVFYNFDSRLYESIKDFLDPTASLKGP